jgi:FkbM family methyltransferase
MLGYENIKGFVCQKETGAFLNLPILTPKDFRTRIGNETAILLVDSRGEVFVECADLPHAYCSDWCSAFMTIRELMLEKAFIDRYAKDVICALDVGRKNGIISLLLLDNAKKVIGFEPNVYLQAALNRNTEHFTQFSFEQVALSDEIRKGAFFLDIKGTGGSSFIFIEGQYEGTLEVTMTTLDRYCEDNGIIPDFIKIDAEGFDGKVIMGGKATITKHRPPIMFEMWRHNWVGVKDALAFLEEYYSFIDLNTGLTFHPNIYQKYAEEFVGILGRAGHTNIGCIPKL